VEVGVGVCGHVIIDGKVDTLNVDTTAEDISCNTDTLVELLKLLVTLNALLLSDARMDSNTGEVALAQKLVKLCGAECALDEDDDLIEFKLIEQIIELTILLAFANLQVVLLETVEGKLGLIIDVDFKGVLHELLADWSRLLGESGGEHHDLLLCGSSAENLLNIAAHVNLVQHLITLIEDESLDVAEAKLLVSNQSVQTARSSDDDVWMGLLVGQELNVLLHWGTAVKDSGLDIGHVLAESGVLVLDLVGQLTGVAHDEDRGRAINGLDLLQAGEHEDGGLSQSGFGLADDIGTENGLRNANLLDWISQIMSE